MKLFSKSNIIYLIIVILSVYTYVNHFHGDGHKQQNMQPALHTIHNCGTDLRYSKVPQKALVHDINMLEMMLELGLEKQMIGYTGVSGYGNQGRILPKYSEALKSLKEYTPKEMSMEIVLSSGTDFIFAGWHYGFTENGVNPKRLERSNIMSYTLTESCAWVTDKQSARLEDVQNDFRNLGKIFGAEKKAESIIKLMNQRVDKVSLKIKKHKKPLKVFVYDSGDKTAFSCGSLAMTSELIRLAGGENILSNLKKTWVRTVAWETVVKHDPEWIVIFDYDDADQKKKFFKNHPVLKNLNAVKNNRFISFHYPALVPGARTADTVEKLALAFYPKAFAE